ncbi:MAG TPA: trehalose-phosphatase [Syntrophorhabdaceae bacterium]|nr:trehalose-phosphatase [Syntrophorhabdaceae bacterium]
MLDFDGTLVPIMKNPEECYLSDEVRHLLSMLSRHKDFTIGIISGRSLPDLRKRIGIKNIYYSGSHGLEISGPGIRFVHPDAKRTRTQIFSLKKSVEKELGLVEGVLIEGKNYSFSFHYRMLERKNIAPVLRRFKDAISRSQMMNENILILKGKKVVEIIPSLNWNKGSAVTYIMSNTRRGLYPVFVGDDRTDESVFSELAGRGLTVRIGKKKETSACYYLRSQKEVTRFLENMLDLRSS